jgi:iron complex outermembrane recepter protein
LKEIIGMKKLITRHSSMLLPLPLVATIGFPSVAQSEIEEVIVTATRRSETQQSVPISITALSAQRLELAGMDGVRDIAMVTPGLNMENRSDAYVPYIRGIGAQDTSGGQEASIAIYIDGVYQSSVHAGALTFNNIDRVEVLKGPQGTLFGRNATGGLIHVITREPGQELEVLGKVGYGDYNTLRSQLYVGGGIAENLVADIALNYKDQGDSWGTNVFDGREYATITDKGVRTKWVWTPFEGSKIVFAADWQEHDTGMGNIRSLLPGAVGADGSVKSGGFYDVNMNFPGPQISETIPNGQDGNQTDGVIENWGILLKAEQDLSWADFVSITAYRGLEQYNVFDTDALPSSVVEASQDVNDTSTFTQEFQLLSNSEGRLNWILGAFYLNDESGYQGPNGLTISGSQVIPIPGAYVSFVDAIKTQSIAAFAEATYEITDYTRLTLGARYTHESKELGGEQRIFTVFPGVLFAGAPALVTIPFDESFEAANGVELKETWTEPTYKISVEHDLVEDVMIYGSYNRGFRSGSYNTVGVTGVPVEPELVDAYEVGFKSEWLDRRVRLNGAFFYYDYQGLQVVLTRGPSTDLINAGEAEILGFDGELEASVSDTTTLRLGVSLLDTEYVEFEEGNLCSHRGADGRTRPGTSPQTVGQPCSVEGNTLVRSPENTVNLGLSYRQPVSFGVVGGSLDFMWSDSFYWEVDNRLEEPSKALLNGALYWRSSDSRWGLTLWGRNMTDEKYSTFSVAQATGSPSGIGDHYNPAAPRTWGMDLNFEF